MNLSFVSLARHNWIWFSDIIWNENLCVIKLYTKCRHNAYFVLYSHLGAICAVQFYISTYLSLLVSKRGGRRCDIEIHKFFSSFSLPAISLAISTWLETSAYNFYGPTQWPLNVMVILYHNPKNMRIICTTLHTSQIESWWFIDFIVLAR